MTPLESNDLLPLILSNFAIKKICSLSIVCQQWKKVIDQILIKFAKSVKIIPSERIPTDKLHICPKILNPGSRGIFNWESREDGSVYFHVQFGTVTLRVDVYPKLLTVEMQWPWVGFLTINDLNVNFPDKEMNELDFDAFQHIHHMCFRFHDYTIHWSDGDVFIGEFTEPAPEQEYVDIPEYKKLNSNDKFRDQKEIDRFCGWLAGYILPFIKLGLTKFPEINPDRFKINTVSKLMPY